MTFYLTPAHHHLLEFIDLYREEPCLWQIKSKEYSNRNLKQMAYDKLVTKWQEVDPEATKDIVVKKINSIRTCFRKELKKVAASILSGCATEDVYCPTLWYYSNLEFLRDLETPRESISNLNLQPLYCNETSPASTSSQLEENEDDEVRIRKRRPIII